jgi:1-acyl-sn-glycerol-3-phosphate acyltransferase
MARLESAVETRTQELIAQATGEPVRPSILVPAPDEIARSAAVQAA